MQDIVRARSCSLVKFLMMLSLIAEVIVVTDDVGRHPVPWTAKLVT